MIKEYILQCYEACLAGRIRRFTMWLEGSVTFVRIVDNEGCVTEYTLDPKIIGKFEKFEQDWWTSVPSATVEQLQSEYELAYEQDMPDMHQKYNAWLEALNDQERTN